MSQLYSVAQRTERNAPAGPSYLWEPPGKPVAVRIPLELIDRLEHEAVENFRSIEAKGSETGGLLFGSSSPGTPAQVFIEDYQAVACDYSRGPLYRLSEADLARFDEVAERRNRESGLRVIGFFRSHTRKGLALDADDLAVIEARFGDPLQIALLVRPFATKPSAAGIFVWEDGKMRGESSYLEFPFQSAQLGTRAASDGPGAAKLAAQASPGTARPVTRAQVVPMNSRLKIATPAPPAAAVAPPPPTPAAAPAAAPAATPAAAPRPADPPAPIQAKTPEAAPAERPAAEVKPEPAVEPSPASEPVTSARAFLSRKVLVIAAAAVLLACSGVLFIYPGLARRSGHPANPAAIPFALHVDRTATDLVLTWSRESDAIRTARHATLSISDGDRQENVDMNLADLRNGSVVYTPMTGDTSFRMEVTGPDGSKSATESVRVLRSKPSAMSTPDTKAPTSAKNDTPAAAGPAAEAPAEEAAAPAPKRTVRAFNAESLAQRLHSTGPASDVPDAPVLSAAAPSAAGFSFTAAPATPLPTAAAPAAPNADAPRQSSISEARLLNRVDPQLLPTMRRLSGQVRVLAVIGRDGHIKSAKAVSGPQMLFQPTVDAVLRWVYTPMILNGQPVEAEKEILVNYAGR